MKYEDFGRIVASLREDLGFSQYKLAELAGIPPHVLSLLERGKKGNLSPELLVALANALLLSTVERREFMLASTGVDTADLVRPDEPHSSSNAANPEKILEKLQEIGSQFLAPAFVIDQYYDFVMVNKSMLALFKVEQPLIDYLGSIPRGFNSIHLTFGNGLLAQSQMDWNWDDYAYHTMRGFRRSCLRFRNHPYLKYLLNAFRNPEEYPFFNRFWNMVASNQEDAEADWDFLEYKDKAFGHLKYMAIVTEIFTAFGNLQLIKYSPLNENTDHLFRDMAKTHGTQMLRFASWPEKDYPGKPKPGEAGS
jgi:transcriptional regulator with XRE-family HTH domain